MNHPKARGSRERTLLELMEALSSSLNLHEVLTRSYDILSRLLVADYAAICVSKPGHPSDYDWVVTKMPPQFFAHYPELAHEDFVRRAVIQRPNTVLRDSEMVSREELERSPFYTLCRELRMPLEHVMAVLLDVGYDWHGGFMLYRERRRPFSTQQRHFLQQLTGTLASTVRNCRQLGMAQERGQLLEALFHHEVLDSIVLVPPETELYRTPRVTELVHRWFSPIECGRHGLPTPWLERLAQLAPGEEPARFGQDIWERVVENRCLRVTFVRLPRQGGRQPWALLLEEVLPVSIPSQWKEKLTQRERQVVELILQGVDNQTIANELHCALDTVKTHLKKIYLKLAVPSRAKLLSAASELNTQNRSRADRRRP